VWLEITAKQKDYRRVIGCLPKKDEDKVINDQSAFSPRKVPSLYLYQWHSSVDVVYHH